MCNLYKLRKTSAEVAKWFDTVNGAAGANFASDVYPGYPGLVQADGNLRSMAWGFPLQRTGKKGQPLKPKPVNNARTDKLGGFFWRSSFENRRCLIPLSAWAEAEGEKGSMTRTWLSVPGADIFAVGGIWRTTDEWGDAYSMVMMDAEGEAAQIHSRMPVILHQADFATWVGGSAKEAFALCQGWRGELEIDRTNDPWFAQTAADGA